MEIARIIDARTIHVFDLGQFDVDAIAHSGQVFRWVHEGGAYKFFVGGHFAAVVAHADKAVVTCDEAGYFWRYFDFDTDYRAIAADLGNFPTMKKILDTTRAGGIRILRAPFVEMVVSFIVSANNNIKRFTRTLNTLCERFGTRKPWGFAFPTLQQLCHITEADFSALGCGYRSGHLVRAIAELMLPAFDVEALRGLGDAELERRLCGLGGVGPKVANCVMLFCGDFHRLGVAPRDTWINRALEQIGDDRPALLSHPFAGVAQQYLFYYLQHLRKVI